MKKRKVALFVILMSVNGCELASPDDPLLASVTENSTPRDRRRFRKYPLPPRIQALARVLATKPPTMNSWVSHDGYSARHSRQLFDAMKGVDGFQDLTVQQGSGMKKVYHNGMVELRGTLWHRFLQTGDGMIIDPTVLQFFKMKKGLIGPAGWDPSKPLALPRAEMRKFFVDNEQHIDAENVFLTVTRPRFRSTRDSTEYLSKAKLDGGQVFDAIYGGSQNVTDQRD